MEHRDLCLAVLIDADNAPSSSIREVLEEISVYGSPTIKRIYGDWTKPNLSSWKKLLLEHAITPIQQYGYTTGKNSTDSAMIIDAMDILYSNRVDGFVLVSSDSDFTRLATRLREAGMKVIGIGEKKTPKPFIVACDKFIYVEVIRAAAAEAARQAEQESEPEPEPEKPKSKSKKPQEPGVVGTLVAAASPPSDDSGVIRHQKLPKLVVACIASSIEDLADEDGYVLMGELANLIMKKQPDFDPRNFGYRKLTQLVKSHSRFEVEMRPDPTGHGGKQVYVRDRQAKTEND